MSSPLKLYEVDEERTTLSYREEAMLHRLGWKHTSSNPIFRWMWERVLPDGRTVIVDRDTAIEFSVALELEADPREPIDG